MFLRSTEAFLKPAAPAPRPKGLAGILRPNSGALHINDENTPPPPACDVYMAEEEDEIISAGKQVSEAACASLVKLVNKMFVVVCRGEEK